MSIIKIKQVESLDSKITSIDTRITGIPAGPTGPQGSQGRQGPTGAQGNQGPTGFQGNQGPAATPAAECEQRDSVDQTRMAGSPAHRHRPEQSGDWSRLGDQRGNGQGTRAKHSEETRRHGPDSSRGLGCPARGCRRLTPEPT